MESNSSSGKIHCSKAAALLLEIQDPGASVTLRGWIPIKGKGIMETYWVDKKKGAAPSALPECAPENARECSDEAAV